MNFIQKAVPESISATAQGLYSAIAMGLVLAVVMSGAGALYAAWASGAFYAMAVLCAVGGCTAVLLARSWDGGSITLGKTVPAPARLSVRWMCKLAIPWWR